MCGIEMAVYATYQCPMQAYITGWLDAGLQYPQCVHCDAAVLHLAIDIIVHGQ